MLKILHIWIYQKIEILIFLTYLITSCDWGIKESIIKSEESWITFVLPLPCLNEFDLIHFLVNFESKIFIIKFFKSQINLLIITCWLFYRWLERNSLTSIWDMKNDQVEAKNKNHFNVTKVGRSFCFCSSFLFSILSWRFMNIFVFYGVFEW